MVQRLLFICSQNKLRSPTAEQVFSVFDGLECDSAGLAPDAVAPFSADQLEWADIVFVMERQHRSKLSKRFKQHLNGKRVIVLGIPDDYDFMDDEFVRLLKVKAPSFLR